MEMNPATDTKYALFKAMNINTTKVVIIYPSCSMIKCFSTFIKI